MIKNYMVPLYQQMVEEIKKEILDGKLNPGEKMMTEAELCQKYEVSRITVRKAIELLTEEGYVVRKQGIGTFVAEKKLQRIMRNQIISFTDMCKNNGQKASADLLGVEWINPDPSIARHLNVTDSSKVLKITRVRRMDDQPVMIEESFYHERMSFHLQANLTGSTYQVFKEHDLIPTHSTKTIEICYATKVEAERLGVPEKQALMLQKDVVHDQNGEIIHYSKLVINSERYQLQIII